MAEKGKYRTRHQEEILRYLQSTRGMHHTAAQIKDHFAGEQKNIGTATIYRQLERMVEEGSVRRYLLETGDSDAVFEDPIHPYTKNLMAAVPKPDPIMQHQTGEGYDPVSAGIIYENGSWHSCEKDPSHRVWCTDAEWKKWGKGK